jgi:hypothetical protein
VCALFLSFLTSFALSSSTLLRVSCASPTPLLSHFDGAACRGWERRGGTAPMHIVGLGLHPLMLRRTDVMPFGSTAVPRHDVGQWLVFLY